MKTIRRYTHTASRRHDLKCYALEIRKGGWARETSLLSVHYLSDIEGETFNCLWDGTLLR